MRRCEAAYHVGSRVVDEIVAKWSAVIAIARRLMGAGLFLIWPLLEIPWKKTDIFLQWPVDQTIPFPSMSPQDSEAGPPISFTDWMTSHRC